jgi:protein-L-isoaspartate O-methyltransferase
MNELMQRVQINEITAGRDHAIGQWLAAYDSFHHLTADAASASVGGAISLLCPTDDRYGDTSTTRAFLSRADHVSHDRERGTRTTIPARDHFAQLVTAAVDRRCWSHLLDTLGFDQLLDRQAREEWRESLKTAPPAFTGDNCAATFSHIWENRRDLYLRGIANTFAALDRRFRSHDGFKIGGRLILNRALSEGRSYWQDYNRRDTLRDVERIFRELDGKGPCSESESIANRVTDSRGEPTPYVLHGDYFRIRIFGNGNLHIWFERKDLLRQVNLLLAEYYGEAIGDGYDTTEADDAPQFHVTPAKDFGAFNSSEAVAARVMQYSEMREGMTVLEPSAGTGVLAKAAREAGGLVSCIELQPGLAHELTVLHGFTDVLQGDFLQIEPRAQFDRIHMNPPFDHGRDCDHVRHAYAFLKPGGVLVAVMSARAEYRDDKRHRAFRQIVEQAKPAYGWMKWHDLPERSFAHAGTNVNTVILAIRKPG